MVTTFTIAHSPLVQAVFWVVVAFIIFFVLFGKRLWTVMAAALDARAVSIRAEIAEAGRLREEAETMLRDAETRRSAALAEAKALLERVKEEAAGIAQGAAAEAEKAGERRERMARDRIQAAEKAAVAAVRIAAVDVATAAAAEVIREELDSTADAALVNRAIAGLPMALARKVG
ncbi:MAG: F0F1 ATP synthase subunit B [Acetobacteraceae bacterium]